MAAIVITTPHPLHIRDLGVGSYGSVTLVKLSNGKLVAMKIINLVDRQKLGVTQPIELDIMSRLRHPNLLCLIGFNFKEDIYLTLLIPLAAKGDLVKIMQTVNNQELIIKLIKDACLGLEFLHSQGISHNDVKPDNILVFENDASHSLRGVLADFGGASYVGINSTIKSSSITGTALYMSPERLENKMNYIPFSSLKEDTWAIGMTLLESVISYRRMDQIFLNDAPDDELVETVYQNISSLFLDMDDFLIKEVYFKVSSTDFEKYKQVFKATLTDYSSRISITEILAMPLFAGRTSKFTLNLTEEDEFDSPKEVKIVLSNQEKVGPHDFILPPQTCSIFDITHPTISVQLVNNNVKLDPKGVFSGLTTIFSYCHNLVLDDELGMRIIFLAIDLYYRWVGNGFDSIPNYTLMGISAFWLAAKLIGTRLATTHLKLFEHDYEDLDLIEAEQSLIRTTRGILNQANLYDLALAGIIHPHESDTVILSSVQFIADFAHYLDKTDDFNGYQMLQNEFILYQTHPDTSNLIELPTIREVFAISRIWRGMALIIN